MALSKQDEKQTWTVYIDTDLPKPNNRFLHIDVDQYYQQDGMLYIYSGKRGEREYKYDLKHVKQIQVRKEQKGGFV